MSYAPATYEQHIYCKSYVLFVHMHMIRISVTPFFDVYCTCNSGFNFKLLAYCLSFLVDEEKEKGGFASISINYWAATMKYQMGQLLIAPYIHRWCSVTSAENWAE